MIAMKYKSWTRKSTKGDTMFCSVCGAQNDDNAPFCTQCGTPLAGSSEGVDQSFSQAQPQQSMVPQQQPQPQMQQAPIQQQAQYQQPPMQPGFQQMPYAPEQPKQVNGLGIAGFVCALCAAVFSWIPILNWILWIVGLVLSGIGVTKQPKGLAIAGLVISLVSLVLIIAIIGCVAGVAGAGAGIAGGILNSLH